MKFQYEKTGEVLGGYQRFCWILFINELYIAAIATVASLSFLETHLGTYEC